MKCNFQKFRVTRHCLSAWGDRMWDFAVGLYMVILYPNSLLLTAILGFATALGVILFGSTIGSWIDNTTRIKSTTLAIVVQNLAVAIGATGLALMFVFSDDIKMTWNGALEFVIYGLIILVSVIANLGSVASDIAIERDWIVVLTEGDEKNLATMNAVMRTIDLTTKVLAPMAVGALISFWSPITGAVFIVAWNIISGFVEIYILLLIYKKIPRLSYKVIPQYKDRKGLLRECWNGWRSYIMHPIKWAGIGFSCLYMSVLGLDQITIGYMYNQGIGESLAGAITALAAVTGIMGSLSYPSLRHRVGPRSTFTIGYLLNAVFLSLCVISVFLAGSPFDPGAIVNTFTSNNAIDNTSGSSEHTTLSIKELWMQKPNIFCFVAGIVFARIGLWITDLSMTQLLQDKVEQTKRGSVNGVQNAMNQIMDMLKFAFVILLPSPQTFGYLVFASWTFGCLGWILHCVFSVRSKSEENDVSINITLKSGTDQAAAANKNALVDEHTPLLVSK